MAKDTKPRARGRPRSKQTQPDRTKIQAVDRALDVYRLVSQEVAATLTVLSAAADLPYSTTHRILETLRSHDLVYFDELRQTWSIGVESFRIGQAYAQRATYLDMGREAMQILTDETGETSNIAVREGPEVVFVSQIETSAPIRAFFPPGSSGLMQVSGIGKALLAHLDPGAAREWLTAYETPAYTANTMTDQEALMADLAVTQRRGWAVDNEERYPGLRCIGAAIFNEFGEPVAGISVSGPAQRLDEDAIETIGPKVKANANWVTEATGGRMPAE